MGLFFCLFVESGDFEKGNEPLKTYFERVGTIETKHGEHKLMIHSTQNNGGITVSVNETGWTGLGRPGEKAIATEVGHAFYKLLMEAPKFRYAMVGVEAGEWVDGQDILDENFSGYLPNHGIVLNNELGKLNFKQLVPFKDGYSWIPYEGEI